MLKPGGVFSRLLEQAILGADASKAEEFGLILAPNKEQVVLTL